MERVEKFSTRRGTTTVAVHAIDGSELNDIASVDIDTAGVEVDNSALKSNTVNGNAINDKAANGTAAAKFSKNGVNSTKKFDGTKEANGLYDDPSKDWNEKYELIVRGPFDYQFGKPGKDFRRQLLLAFNVWLEVEDRTFEIIDRVVGMLHNSSLLIDDIQDGSKLRRGSPAAHCVFGTAQAINSANYIYFLAQNELLKLENCQDALQIFTEELLNLHRGQGLELYWRDEAVVPSEREYLMMVANKTGGLFRLGARLLHSASRTNYDVVPLADVMGIAFQIYDDYKNLCSDKMAAEKGYCEDLTEGKFSFPVIHALGSSEAGGRELLNILRLRTEDIELKAHAVKIMRDETKSLDYAKKTVQRYSKDANDLLASFGKKNVAMENLLRKISA